MLGTEKIDELIVGSGGRLGRALVKRLSSRGREVAGLDRSALDLGEPDAIRAALSGVEFRRAIVCGAMTAVDACESERELAMRVNAEGPARIASICRERGARLTYISTDFVFDGQKEGAYREDDEPRPLGMYGRSKLAGERAVLAAAPDNLVVRVSWLYGRERPAFPEWIIGQAMEKDELSLPAEKTGSPTSCEDLAELIEPLLGEAPGRSPGGVLHLCNSGNCTWQEWGQACLDLAIEAGLPLKCRTIGANRMADIAAFVAKRPVNSVLCSGRYTELTGIRPRSWRSALREHVLGMHADGRLVPVGSGRNGRGA